jgi:fructose-specific phosphotransferase system IIC component
VHQVGVITRILLLLLLVVVVVVVVVRVVVKSVCSINNWLSDWLDSSPLDTNIIYNYLVLLSHLCLTWSKYLP